MAFDAPGRMLKFGRAVSRCSRPHWCAKDSWSWRTGLLLRQQVRHGATDNSASEAVAARRRRTCQTLSSVSS